MYDQGTSTEHVASSARIATFQNIPEQLGMTFRRVRVGGDELLVADTNPQFWAEYSQRLWEPETFALFEQLIDSETVYVDVGAWIGPTVLLAAQKARKVIAFEPDPVAFAALEQTVGVHSRKSDITIFPVAIAARAGAMKMGSRSEQGDSMSSSLIENAAVTWTARAQGLQEFEFLLPEGAPLFIKIDIEGGEYDLLPSLDRFLSERQASLYLSLHSHIFIGTTRRRSLVRRAWREVLLFGAFLRCWPVLRRFPFIYTMKGERLSSLGLLHRAIWRRSHALVLSYSSWVRAAN